MRRQEKLRVAQLFGPSYFEELLNYLSTSQTSLQQAAYLFRRKGTTPAEFIKARLVSSLVSLL